MLNRFAALTGLLLLLLTATSGSAAILYYTDRDLGSSVIPGAITLAAKTGVQATSTSDLVAKLTSGSWEAVIIGEQNNTIWDASLATALTNYVSAGGHVIGATWKGNSGMAAFFQATVVSSNVTSISTTSHPIFNGLGASIALASPGWTVYSQSYNPSASQGLGIAGSGYGVVLGNNGHTLLNAPLFDSFASAAQGQRFLANEINFLISPPVTSVPAASTLSLSLLAILLAISAAFVLPRRSFRPVA